MPVIYNKLFTIQPKKKKKGREKTKKNVLFIKEAHVQKSGPKTILVESSDEDICKLDPTYELTPIFCTWQFFFGQM